MIEDPDQLAIFVMEYIRAGDAPDAGVVAVTRAGLRDPAWPPSSMAERILADPEIQQKIKFAKTVYKPLVTKDVSRDTISSDMETIYQKALGDRQFQAAIGAKKLQAELHSLLKQTVEHNHNITVKTVPDAQLEKIAAGGVIEGEFAVVADVANKS